MDKDSFVFKGLTYFLIVLFAGLIVVVGNMICSTKVNTQDDGEFYKAKVISVEGIREESIDVNSDLESEESTQSEQVTNKTLIFTAEILDGDYKGQTVTAFQDINELYGVTPVMAEEGQKIVIALSTSGSELGINWYYAEPYRTTKLGLLIGFFLILILFIGKLKGVATIIALIFDVLMIFLVYIPSIFKEYNIYVTTTIVAFFLVVISLLLINGPDKKTLAASLGNLGGLLVAGIIAAIMNYAVQMTGLVDEEYMFLTNASLGFTVDLKASIWSCIVIGALGAVMDVAMSISSAINELADNMKDASFSTLFRSGMNIGQDAIGTMTNTLILAYIGSSLVNVLLYITYNKNMIYLLNTEVIAAEVMQAIIGSIGILFAVPSTALVAAYLFGKNDTKHNRKNNSRKKKRRIAEDEMYYSQNIAQVKRKSGNSVSAKKVKNKKTF